MTLKVQLLNPISVETVRGVLSKINQEKICVQILGRSGEVVNAELKPLGVYDKQFTGMLFLETTGTLDNRKSMVYARLHEGPGTETVSEFYSWNSVTENFFSEHFQCFVDDARAAA